MTQPAFLWICALGVAAFVCTGGATTKCKHTAGRAFVIQLLIPYKSSSSAAAPHIFSDFSLHTSRPKAKTMSQLETAMAMLMQTFDTYAGKDGKKESMSKTEVKTMLEKELPALLKTAKNQAEVDKLLKGLDFNGDSEVDFKEFVVMVAALTCAAHGRCSKN
uniref:S100 calcium binding protein P n=1 Tax=Oryzias melastigma TaxID=30732 RepID=A0A3B3BAS8_ORYME